MITPLTTTGTLRVKEHKLTSEWTTEWAASDTREPVAAFQLHRERIAILTAEGALRVKDGGLSASWTVEWDATGKGTRVVGFQLASYASDASGGDAIERIGILTSDGVFRVKDGGLSASWTTVWETTDTKSSVDEFQLAADVIAMKTSDGMLRFKKGSPSAEWATAFALNPRMPATLSGYVTTANRVGLQLSDGTFLVKEHDHNESWNTSSMVPKTFSDPKAVSAGLHESGSDSRIGMVTEDGFFYVKEGDVNSKWTLEWSLESDGTSVSSFVLQGAGNRARIGMQTSDGAVRVKEGNLGASWVVLWSATETPKAIGYRISGTDGDNADLRIGVLTDDGNLRVKSQSLSDSWTVVWSRNTVYTFQLEDRRIGILTPS